MTVRVYIDDNLVGEDSDSRNIEMMTRALVFGILKGIVPNYTRGLVRDLVSHCYPWEKWECTLEIQSKHPDNWRDSTTNSGTLKIVCDGKVNRK